MKTAKSDGDYPAWKRVLIDNTVPRVDHQGNILNAHDGHVFLRNGTFFLVGTSYTNCHMNQSNSCAGSDGKRFRQDPTHYLEHPACGWTNNDFGESMHSRVLTCPPRSG
eukprot:SAG31_NODE_7857_length_1582_cov_1.264329_3_plen_109_part_00